MKKYYPLFILSLLVCVLSGCAKDYGGEPNVPVSSPGFDYYTGIIMTPHSDNPEEGYHIYKDEFSVLSHEYTAFNPEYIKAGKYSATVDYLKFAYKGAAVEIDPENITVEVTTNDYADDALTIVYYVKVSHGYPHETFYEYPYPPGSTGFYQNKAFCIKSGGFKIWLND